MNSHDACHHCSAPLDGSEFGVVLQGFSDDHRLALCTRCQGLRQSGQLPVDLLVQQWTYARKGPVDAPGDVNFMLVRLDCLGCGARFAPGSSGGEEIASANRLPDGALSTECPQCNRTNVLERRGGQLVAVRLW
jgi:hypothetical protein